MVRVYVQEERVSGNSPNKRQKAHVPSRTKRLMIGTLPHPSLAD